MAKSDLPPEIARLDRLIERTHADLDAAGGDVSIIKASDLRPEPVSWLWPGWLARSKLHLLVGAPGTGKTTLAAALIAALTSGGRWPDGATPEPGRALIWSGEDDMRDTLIPRLIACGADLERVEFVGGIRDDGRSRAFDPAKDLELLREALLGGNVPDLLVLDPIVSAVAGDSHKNAEVRRGLQPVVDLAQMLRCAVLGISHFTKGSAGRDPVERVTGSLAFGALPRVVMAAAKLPEDNGGGRIFVRAKNNLGPDSGGFAYDFDVVTLDENPAITATRVTWRESLIGNARDLLAHAETVENPEDRTATDEAEDWLNQLMADGPALVKDAMKSARAEGMTDKALRRARQRLGIGSRKRAFDGGWEWYFEDAPKPP